MCSLILNSLLVLRFILCTSCILQKSCIDQGKQLESLESWPALLNYILKAWEIIEDLPLWDNPDHNKSRTRCFKTLGVQCKRCINHSQLTQSGYRELLTRSETAFNYVILSCKIVDSDWLRDI